MVPPADESYGLNWVGKAEALAAAQVAEQQAAAVKEAKAKETPKVTERSRRTRRVSVKEDE